MGPMVIMIMMMMIFSSIDYYCREVRASFKGSKEPWAVKIGPVIMIFIDNDDHNNEADDVKFNRILLWRD
jgi:hypothetical protein